MHFQQSDRRDWIRMDQRENLPFIFFLFFVVTSILFVESRIRNDRELILFFIFLCIISLTSYHFFPSSLPTFMILLHYYLARSRIASSSLELWLGCQFNKLGYQSNVPATYVHVHYLSIIITKSISFFLLKCRERDNDPCAWLKDGRSIKFNQREENITSDHSTLWTIKQKKK